MLPTTSLPESSSNFPVFSFMLYDLLTSIGKPPALSDKKMI